MTTLLTENTGKGILEALNKQTTAFEKFFQSFNNNNNRRNTKPTESEFIICKTNNDNSKTFEWKNGEEVTEKIREILGK